MKGSKVMYILKLLVTGGFFTMLGSLITNNMRNRNERSLAKFNAERNIIFEKKAERLKELEDDISKFASKTFEVNMAIDDLKTGTNTINYEVLWELERLNALIKIKLQAFNSDEEYLIKIMKNIFNTFQNGNTIDGKEVDEFISESRLYLTRSWKNLFKEFKI